MYYTLLNTTILILVEKTLDPAEQEDRIRFERPQIGRNRAFGFQVGGRSTRGSECSAILSY